MKKIKLFAVAFGLLIAGKCLAQKCPDIRLTSPDLLKEGEPATFTAIVTGGDPNSTYTYNWSVSAGAISSGQGTSVIIVDTKDLGGTTCTATVMLGGVDRSCSSYASATVSIDPLPRTQLHTKDNYTTVKAFSDEASKFAGDFMSAYYGADSPHAVVFFYPAKTGNSAAAIKQMTATTKTVFAAYGMKPADYKITTGPKRSSTSFEMWIVPKGGEEPKAVQ